MHNLIPNCFKHIVEVSKRYLRYFTGQTWPLAKLQRCHKWQAFPLTSTTIMRFKLSDVCYQVTLEDIEVKWSTVVPLNNNWLTLNCDVNPHSFDYQLSLFRPQKELLSLRNKKASRFHFILLFLKMNFFPGNNLFLVSPNFRISYYSKLTLHDGIDCLKKKAGL